MTEKETEVYNCGWEAGRKTLSRCLRDVMRADGFISRDNATVEEMFLHLLGKIASQQKLEAGLRERLKAAEGAGVFECDTEGGTGCPFHITVGGCNARRSEEHGDWTRCAHEPRHPDFPNQYPERPPCRLDEGPILVKKAEEGTAPGDFVGISKDVRAFAEGLGAKAEADSGSAVEGAD